jgi:type IV secretion system protein VirB10
MNEPPNPTDPRPSNGNAMEPLPGEPGIPNVATAARPPWSKKGLAALLLLIGSMIAVSAFSIQRFVAGGKKPDDESKLVKDRPAAASADPRKLDMAAAASAPKAAAARIPAIEPMADERAEPIGVRRSGQTNATNGGSRPITPEDAPVLLVTSKPTPVANASARAPAPGSASAPQREDSVAEQGLDETRRNLEGYQRQLHGLLDTLTKSATAAAGPVAAGALPMAPPPPGLPGNATLATAKVSATTLGNRSLTLPKGTAFTCALKTRIITATSGAVACQVQRNVYGDDGRVLLIERGSHLDGEYRIASVRPGTVRIPVLWTRLRTPHGVSVDIESPGTGPLGESGVDGYVDNRWGERLGAAMLLSLIDDSVKLVIQNQANDRGGGSGDTIVLPSTTANTSKLAEKVLDSTINIPPLIYQNQGGIVGIVVARDVDFSSVYELEPSSREAQR